MLVHIVYWHAIWPCHFCIRHLTFSPNVWTWINSDICDTYIWLVVSKMTGLFSISYMGCHPSHWRTPSFFRVCRAQPPSNHIFSHFSTYRHSMWQFYKTVTFYSGILTYHSFLLRTRELAHGLAPWYLERPGLFWLKRYLNVGCCLRRQSWTGPLVFECFSIIHCIQPNESRHLMALIVSYNFTLVPYRQTLTVKPCTCWDVEHLTLFLVCPKRSKSVDFLHPKIATLLGNLRFQTIKFIQILCFSMVAPYFFDKSHWLKGKSTGHVCFFHIHFVAKVVEMGFNESDAKRALSSTGPGGQDIEGFWMSFEVWFTFPIFCLKALHDSTFVDV